MGFLSMPTILSGEQWTPSGQTFATHATSTFLTCLAGATISLVVLLLLVERTARQAAGVRSDPHPSLDFAG